MKIHIKIAKLMIAIGIILILCNLFGFYYFTQITPSNPNILDDNKTQISEKEFWSKSSKGSNETISNYVKRLSELVSKRMLLIDPQNCKPTFFENYILWGVANYWGRYEWTNTKMAVRLGGGFCSQHAIIFNNILRNQGIESRILGLSGHVLNEVLIDKKWYVVDSDYNVVFNQSLSELERKPKLVYEKYISIGRPPKEAKHWMDVFSSPENNWHYRTSFYYSCFKSLIEQASFIMIWLFPFLLIIAGICLMNYRLTKKQKKD